MSETEQKGLTSCGKLWNPSVSVRYFIDFIRFFNYPLNGPNVQIFRACFKLIIILLWLRTFVSICINDFCLFLLLPLLLYRSFLRLCFPRTFQLVSFHLRSFFFYFFISTFTGSSHRKHFYAFLSLTIEKWLFKKICPYKKILLFLFIVSSSASNVSVFYNIRTAKVCYGKCD